MMMLRGPFSCTCKLLALMAVLLLHSASPAIADEIAEIESFADLTKLIQVNNVKSVDQLVQVLPLNFERGYALIYRTRALHPELVSPDRPRVLMFGKTGNFILTYNGAASNGIETLEFDQINKKYSLRELDFDGQKVPDLTQIPVNPEKCTRCHAEGHTGEVKLLWDPYNMWPGTYV